MKNISRLLLIGICFLFVTCGRNPPALVKWDGSSTIISLELNKFKNPTASGIYLTEVFLIHDDNSKEWNLFRFGTLNGGIHGLKSKVYLQDKVFYAVDFENAAKCRGKKKGSMIPIVCKCNASGGSATRCQQSGEKCTGQCSGGGADDGCGWIQPGEPQPIDDILGDDVMNP